MRMIWLLWVVGSSLSCSRKYLNDVVVTHFDIKVTPKCQGSGQHCKYDRNCCAGLECKMDIKGLSIVSLCQYRKVYENYMEFMGGPTWKDYQEIESSEEEKLRRENVEELEFRNTQLRKKTSELKMLRKSVRRQQLMGIKQNLEQQEINELKKEQEIYGDVVNQEVELLRQQEMEDKLVNLERKEVNHTLFKQHRVADLYMNMLSDLVDKEAGYNKLTA